MTNEQTRQPALYEQCVVCDGDTGKAGGADDSLFRGEYGPMCEECFDTGPLPVADGIYHNIPDEEYRRWVAEDGSPRLSKSILWKANPTDARQDMQALKLETEKSSHKETDALRLGRALDTRLLEPAKYKELYHIGGPVNKKTGEIFGTGTKAFGIWLHENDVDMAFFLSKKEAGAIEDMVRAIMRHQVVDMIRRAGGEQTSIAWTGPYGVPMRARLDKYIEDYNGCPTIIDVKSIADVRDKTIRNQILNFGYNIQDAIYKDGIFRLTGRLPSFKFLFVSKTEKPQVRVLTIEQPGLGEPFLELGRHQYFHTCRQWAKCCEEKSFPPPYPDVDDFLAPSWVEYAVKEFGDLEPQEQGQEDEDHQG